MKKQSALGGGSWQMTNREADRTEEGHFIPISKWEIPNPLPLPSSHLTSPSCRWVLYIIHSLWKESFHPEAEKDMVFKAQDYTIIDRELEGASKTV